MRQQTSVALFPPDYRFTPPLFLAMFDKIGNAVSSILPPDVGADVKQNVEALVRGGLEKMDLVSREQFEIQQKILERTREKLEALEARVHELETHNKD